MKEVRISLSDDQVSAIEAEIAAGEARSITEYIEHALATYLNPRDMPTRDEMYRMALEAEAEADATGGWYTADEVRQYIRDTLDSGADKD